MKVITTLVLGLIVFAISSCVKQSGTYPDPYNNPLIVLANQILLKKFEEDKKVYAKEVELLLARARAWKHKENDFMKSLSNEELQTYAELKETFKQGDAKHLLAYRKFETLLHESADLKKLTTFKWLRREGGELTKQNEELEAKFQKLEERRKAWIDEAAWLEKEHLKAKEDSRYQEAISARNSANFWNWHYQNQSLFQQQMMNQQLWMLNNTPSR
jgi:hypothetical protein